jgi:metal-responsive CopG/Arc/MetJ family transcriptional regulator
MEDNIVDETPLDRIRMNVWFPRNVYNHINSIASIDGRSMSDVLREAARDYIEKHRDRVQQVPGKD